MKLSDAMRLGAMLRPTQAYFVMFDMAANATCALGAAAEAIGMLDTTQPSAYCGTAPEEWRRVTFQRTTCPACTHVAMRVDSQIIHLNNRHRWTRERIADWVESVEAQQDATLNETPESVRA
jgi:uncharacterized C2H2 Zn-finger protein